ncbi:NAD(P)-dependent alcohol dehydrogenase [Dokdonia sp. Hel_I_53]|uniref:NAD(P)-dependent alcohol dehydrogenase n=1 Tax=Dokdonia sp. Hel_I_53 TaxID=1566287 RepID=UPI0011997361|nr:NAD(P)-dependent alcohol dehydrogenase [Dokdonia sp. Hel_I_53]TVZ53353.1 aryl-alcohol dehydrogenase [Dokdonia sp. Hel_I_53]
MKAQIAVIEEAGEEFTMKHVNISEPNSHEILIKIVATGLCHTDVAVKDGNLPTNYPVVLGHEGAGVVEKVGSHIKDIRKGDHVVLSYGSCGACKPCQEGDPAYCEDFNPLNFMNKRQGGEDPIYKNEHKNINGAFFQQSSFGTYALAHHRNVVKITKEVDLKLMGPLGCGIQTGAGTVMNTLNPNPGTSIAVYGVGSVGLSAIMAAKNAGCSKIIAVDINTERLSLAKELGATDTVNSKEVKNPIKAIKKIVEKGVDFAIEASGIEKVAQLAFNSLAQRGTLAIVGAPPGETMYGFDANDLILSGRKIIGVVEGDSIVKIYIPRLIELYKQGKFPFDKLVTFYDFKDINEALLDMHDGKVIKPILTM